MEWPQNSFAAASHETMQRWYSGRSGSMAMAWAMRTSTRGCAHYAAGRLVSTPSLQLITTVITE